MSFRLFFFLPVDAVQPRRKKSSRLHAVNRGRQHATNCFNGRFYMDGPFSLKMSQISTTPFAVRPWVPPDTTWKFCNLLNSELENYLSVFEYHNFHLEVLLLLLRYLLSSMNCLMVFLNYILRLYFCITSLPDWVPKLSPFILRVPNYGSWTKSTSRKRHTIKVGPGTLDVYWWDPGTPKCLGGTLDPEPPKWDPGPGTPKYFSGTWDFQFSVVLIVYSTLNTSHFTCYRTLR